MNKSNVTLSQNDKNDALLFIKKLHCNSCDDEVGFYLVENVPYCEHCDNILNATQEDYDSISDLGSRAPILRFSGPIG